MKIGELANATDTPVETIRFYEREGLLPVAPRSAGNYRIYGAEHHERLVFVRHCRSLDMSLDEIRVLLRFKDSPADDCAGVNAVLDAHIGHVAARIQGLRRLEHQLKVLREQCVDVQRAGGCGILGELARVAHPAPGAASGLRSHVEATHRHRAAPTAAEARRQEAT
jgi:Cd(II)/Pb(II)-responsive transcriptional regulator